MYGINVDKRKKYEIICTCMKYLCIMNNMDIYELLCTKENKMLEERLNLGSLVRNMYRIPKGIGELLVKRGRIK